MKETCREPDPWSSSGYDLRGKVKVWGRSHVNSKKNEGVKRGRRSRNGVKCRWIRKDLETNQKWRHGVRKSLDERWPTVCLRIKLPDGSWGPKGLNRVVNLHPTKHPSWSRPLSSVRGPGGIKVVPLMEWQIERYTWYYFYHKSCLMSP